MTADRSLDAARALVRDEMTETPLLGVYVYQVVSGVPVLGLDLLPVTPGAPPLQRVSAGNIGPTTLLALTGQRVLVVFEGADPSKPIVLSVMLTSTMLVDSTMINGAGPVTISLPIVAPLVAP